jgi:hypothetical protein
MGIKSISAIIYIILFLMCDPARDISFTIKNNTQHDFKVNTYGAYPGENSYDMLELSSVEFIYYRTSGGGFNAISDFDSIIIFDATNNKKYKWVRPNDKYDYGYIDSEYGIGEEREVPKDMYNVNDWTLEMIGNDEEWTFTINDSDLELFE